MKRDFPKVSRDTMHETIFRFSLFSVKSLTIQESYKFTARLNADRLTENRNYSETLFSNFWLFMKGTEF